jgi:hypothetical protein
MGDRRSWVGGFIVHERGVREWGGGVIVREQAVVAVRGRSSFMGGRGSRVGVVHMVLLVQVVVVWDCRSWVVAVRPQGGTRRPSMEGVVILHKWGEGSPLSVRARPPCGRLLFLGGGRRRTWAVNVSWMGGPSTSMVVPIGGGRCRRRPSSLGPWVKGWAWPCALVLCKWVSGFERGRREHTIDGAIAIDRVHGAPCGGGAFVPLASCCPFPPFPLSFIAWSSKSGAAGLIRPHQRFGGGAVCGAPPPLRSWSLWLWVSSTAEVSVCWWWVVGGCHVWWWWEEEGWHCWSRQIERWGLPTSFLGKRSVGWYV